MSEVSPLVSVASAVNYEADSAGVGLSRYQ